MALAPLSRQLFFIASSAYIVYLMKIKFRPTLDPAIDTLRLEYLVGPCAVLALIFNYRFDFLEVMWAFSIYLEAVAILPQLFILQRTGEAETITTQCVGTAMRVLIVQLHRRIGRVSRSVCV